MRSSMRAVEIGSSAEAGSSISSTSGSTARQRAMQRRCCWPPESAKALRSSRSLTSSHSAAWRSARSTRSSMSSLKPSTRGPKATLSRIDFGNGFGFWKTMPMRRRTSTGSTPRAVEIGAVVEDRALDASRPG